ncbi:tyrosine-protein phosphatase [Clostridium perfringens]|nr:tyrosine-protein phosphatase [Clostridium perfringens]
MEKLNGYVERVNNNKILIKLNRVCKNIKVFYRDALDKKETFLMDFSNTDSLEFEDPKPLNRTFYRIEADGEEIVVAERILPLKNFSNFRDLGGYETQDGRNVKWGLFYRSEDLSDLKGDDLKYFESLGIKYVLDYRSKEEVLNNPDVQIDLVKNINISGMNLKGNDNLDMTGYIKDILSGGKMTISPEELLKEGYEMMPLNNPAYKELFTLFKEPKNMAILQHCTAGKDRTGIGSALVLLALNVPEEIVIQDYLESNKTRKAFNDKVMSAFKDYIKDEKLKSSIEGMLGVDKSLINSSLDTIKNKYGTYERYFEEEYGLDCNKLKELRDAYLY